MKQIASQKSCDGKVSRSKGGNGAFCGEPGASVCAVVFSAAIDRSRRAADLGPPPTRGLENEQQQQRDQQREDAERLGEREAEKERVALAARRRWIAQRACQKLTEHVGDADRGGAHADARQTGADVFRCYGIHWEAPFG